MDEWLKIWDEEILRDWIPDEWQKKVLEHKGNMVLRCGRQVGKSVTTAKKISRFACEYDNVKILTLAPAQRQSSGIFEKVIGNLEIIDEVVIRKAQEEHKDEWNKARVRQDFVRHFRLKYGIYKDFPTKTKVVLKNNTEILCLPAGKTGMYLRFLTIDLLIGDEASFVPDAVWTAVRPMLAVAKQTRGLGWEIYLSTPFGKGGYFYDCCHDSDFLQIHVSSEDCSRIPKEFLTKERLRMSKTEYAQEYKGEFVEAFSQFFPTDLINKCMNFINWEYKTDYDRSKRYYLGADIARYGADENAFVVAEMDDKNHVRVVYCETTLRKSLTDTAGRIMKLNEMYRFNRIFVDDQGIGAGVTDILIEKLGTKVIGLNNARRTLDKEGKLGKIFKEDMYSNAACMMEHEPPQVTMVSNLKLLKSLKCMTFEYTADKNLRIYGKYSHLAEAFVRACWCMKMKGLRLYVF